MFTVASILLPTAHAQPATLTPPPSCISIFTNGTSATYQGFTCIAEYLGMLTYLFLGGAATWCLIMLMVSGIRYMMGPAVPGGSSDAAKKGISSALTGLAVAILAYLILDTFIAALTN